MRLPVSFLLKFYTKNNNEHLVKIRILEFQNFQIKNKKNTFKGQRVEPSMNIKVTQTRMLTVRILVYVIKRPIARQQCVNVTSITKNNIV